MAVVKRQIPCNLCGSADHELLYADELGNEPARVSFHFTPETRRTYRIVRCRNCGLIFTNPMPDLDHVYETNVDPVYVESTDERRRTAAKAMVVIRRYKTEGQLLDVGCATGIFLDEAARDFQTEGVELSTWAGRLAARRHTVYDRPLRALEFSDCYDVVTLWGVIEHFRDPWSEMQTVFRALRPGGIVALYTGDVDAWLPRLLGKSWWWYQGMHLYYFSRGTASALLEKCGFRIVFVGRHTVYFSLRSLGNSLSRYRLARFIRPFLKIAALDRVVIPITLSGEMLLIAERPMPSHDFPAADASHINP